MTTIQVGTRISGGPYNYGIGIVTRYEPGGAGCFVIGRGLQPVAGYVDIAWPTHESTHTPVNIVTSLPYRVHTDRLGTPEEIAGLRAQAAIHAASEAAKKDEAAIARAAERGRLLADYPHLLRCGEKLDSLNAASKNIRTMLKAAFPAVKFGVRSQRYSGGQSIDVDWTDGPTTSEVKSITNRFEGGSFDGMTDCYNYNHSVWCDLFGDAKYVFENRRHSPDALLAACRKLLIDYPRGNWTPETLAHAYDHGNLRFDDDDGWFHRELQTALGYQ